MSMRITAATMMKMDSTMSDSARVAWFAEFSLDSAEFVIL